MAKKNNTNFFSENAITFLENYIHNSSPSGFEENGQRLWINYLKPFIDTYEIDNYGTAVGIINKNAKFKVVIAAHADEISWMVKYISKDGFIYITENGGTDPQIALSKQVNIFTPNGIVKGVIGNQAIHTRDVGKEKHPKTNKLWIDVGAKNNKEVEKLGIHIGCVCTYDEGFIKMQNGYWAGRAMDNKIGGFIIAEVARLLKENKIKLPFGLYIVNAVQEEVGMNGASMIVESIAPDMAIVTDVTHDTSTPNIDMKTEGEVYCGKGATIMYSPPVHLKVLNLIKQTAIAKKIPFQLEAYGTETGTDADAFAFGNCGVPSALISMPLRYMHTSVEMLHSLDVENCIKLIYETLLAIDTKMKFTYDI